MRKFCCALHCYACLWAALRAHPDATRASMVATTGPRVREFKYAVTVPTRTSTCPVLFGPIIAGNDKSKTLINSLDRSSKGTGHASCFAEAKHDQEATAAVRLPTLPWSARGCVEPAEFDCCVVRPLVLGISLALPFLDEDPARGLEGSVSTCACDHRPPAILRK